jgi:hypothetical protein
MTFLLGRAIDRQIMVNQIWIGRHSQNAQSEPVFPRKMPEVYIVNDEISLKVKIRILETLSP